MGGAGNANLLKTFVLSKLEGKALESVSTEPADVDQITTELKSQIKPEYSKIIEGRMLALQFNASKIQDCSKDAEDLAEALQQALIVEGISQQKAKSMAIVKNSRHVSSNCSK